LKSCGRNALETSLNPPLPTVLQPLHNDEMFEVDKYPRLPWRLRLIVVALTLAAVSFVLFAMTSNPVPASFKPLQQNDKPLCQPGQSTDCVGGTATVILAPAVPALPTEPAGSAPP